MARSVKRLAKQRRQASRTAASPPTLRYVSCWPAKLTFGQILGGGGAAHGHRQLGAVLLAQALMCGEDLGLEILGQRRLVHDLAGAPPASGEIVDVARVETLQGRAEWTPGAGLVENVAIRLGRDGEAVRHEDALGPESPIHLPERGVLASDQRHVVTADLLEQANVLERAGHGIDVRGGGRASSRRFARSWESPPVHGC